MTQSTKSAFSKISTSLHIRIAKKLLGPLTFNLFRMRGGLKPWFYSALIYQFKKSKEYGTSPFGNYYEFGVGLGGSMLAYFQALKIFCDNRKMDTSKFQIFAFDTFEGLPESENPADKHPGWVKNRFACDIPQIKKRIQDYGVDLNKINTRFIKGNFETSLTATLRDEIKKFPPSIITIDVDYYTSTKTVLDWLEPILVSGTLFYFDDIWHFHGNPNYGELKAINEFNERIDGYLTSFPVLGMPGKVYIYSRKEFEY